jgi:hypothetical protein
MIQSTLSQVMQAACLVTRAASVTLGNDIELWPRGSLLCTVS